MVYHQTTMLRTNVYLTEEQERAIKIRAAVMKKPKAEILREVINDGLRASPAQKSTSMEAFLKLAELGKQFKGTAPKDLSINHDKYTWDD